MEYGIIFLQEYVDILCIPRNVLRRASVTPREIPGRILVFEDCALLGVRQSDAGVRREVTCFTTFLVFLGGRFCKVAIKTLLPELAMYAVVHM